MNNTLTPMLLGVFVGLVIGNFGYHLMSHRRDWAAATSVTFFQAIALIAVWLNLQLMELVKK